MPEHGPSPEARWPIEGVSWLEHVLYHFDFVGDRLVIGKFCSIAAETTFVMNGGNHMTTWLTTYPFPIFGHGWEGAEPPRSPQRGDTRVRNDAVAWWDWDIEKVTRHLRAICGGDVEAGAVVALYQA